MADFILAFSTWLNTMPIWVLYALLGTVAFFEGLFPPIPADVVVALGSFVASRRGADYSITTACIAVGSVSGAMVTYAVARRFGADWLHARLRKAGIENLEKRLEEMYSHYGLVALFVSRFLPAIRMIAAPMAGATRVPPVRTAFVFLVASVLWYGAIAWIAFRVGDDWEQVRAGVQEFAREVGSVALIVAALFALIVLLALRRRAARRVRLARASFAEPKDG